MALAWGAAGAPALLFCALDSGLVLAVEPWSGCSTTLGCAQPPKGVGLACPPLLLPLGGPAARQLLLFASPGRSALFLSDVGAAVGPPPAGARPAALLASAQALKLRTDLKKPLTALAAHPGGGVAYAGYANGAVRAYQLLTSAPPAPAALALRGSYRTDAGGKSAAGAASPVLALALLPHGAPGGFAHLLVAADVSGRLTAWSASPGSGALETFASCCVAPPTAPPARVAQLLPLPGLATMLVRCVTPGGGCALSAFVAAAAAGGGSTGTLTRCSSASAYTPTEADIDALVRAAAAQGALPPDMAAAACRPGGVRCALGLPGASSQHVALLVGSHAGAGRLVCLRSRARAVGARGADCQLVAPGHTPCEADLAQPVAHKQQLFYITGELVARYDGASGTCARHEELPQLPPGGGAACPARLLRCDQQRLSLVLARHQPGAPPAQVCVVRDGATPASAAPSVSRFRPAADAAFLGARCAHCALLDAGGRSLDVFAAHALDGGAATCSVRLGAEPVSRLFQDDGHEHAASLLYAVDGRWLGRIPMGAVLRHGATAAQLQPRLALLAGECVLTVAWQRTPRGDQGAASCAAVLTDMRAVVLDSRLEVLTRTQACGGGGGGDLGADPPCSLLWLGPALLFSTRLAVWHLDWQGRSYRVAAVDCAGGGGKGEGEGGDAAEAPLLLSAAQDRLLLLYPGRGHTPRAMELRIRSASLGEAVQRGWASWHQRWGLPSPPPPPHLVAAPPAAPGGTAELGAHSVAGAPVSCLGLQVTARHAVAAAPSVYGSDAPERNPFDGGTSQRGASSAHGGSRRLSSATPSFRGVEEDRAPMAGPPHQPPRAPHPPPALPPRPPSTVPSDTNDHLDDSSSEEEQEGGASYAGRPRFVVNIKAPGAAPPSLPPKPLPRLPGGAGLPPPSVRVSSDPGAAAPPQSVRGAAASHGPVSYVGRPFDPFAALAEAEGEAGSPFGAPAGGAGASNPF